MQKKLFKQTIIGFIFVGIVGSICHFAFEWSGYNSIVGMYCAVNESSWEHLKLIFFPYLIWSIIEYFLLGRKKGIFFAKSIGVIAGMLSILMLFYTYTGIIGKNIDFLDILIFFIGVFIAFAVDYIIIKSNKFASVGYDVAGIIIFVALDIMFMLFTFYPPLIPLFKDPLNSSYGI